MDNEFSFSVVDQYYYPKPKSFNQASGQITTIYLLIDILKDAIEKETDDQEKANLEARLKNKFRTVYRNHPKVRECFNTGEIDERRYLLYLKCFMEIIEMDDRGSKKDHYNLMIEVSKELDVLDRIAHN